MTGNNCIVRVKLRDNTTFITDEASMILHEYQHGKEMITICLIGRSVSFLIENIKILQLYPKTSKVDK